MPAMKTIIVAALGLVLAALAAAGVLMLRHKPDGENSDKRMAWALATRVALSVAIFLLVLLAHGLGWIQPHALGQR